jgi:transcriptional regulator with XRE-family HTH domain
MTTNQIIGRNIRMLRVSKGVPQTELARVLNLTFQQIQKYEKGHNSVKPDALLKIAAYFDCHIMDLLRGLVDVPKKSDSALDKLMSQADMSIVFAYSAIQSPKQKAALLALAKTLSGGEANV